jgi:hypothetical protein
MQQELRTENKVGLNMVVKNQKAKIITLFKIKLCQEEIEPKGFWPHLTLYTIVG